MATHRFSCDAQGRVVTRLKLVLALGCRREVIARCREVAPARTLVRDSTLVDATARALRWQPHAILLPRELYELDEPAFTKLAERALSTLVPLPHDDVPAEALRCVLRHAMDSAETLRQP